MVRDYEQIVVDSWVKISNGLSVTCTAQYVFLIKDYAESIGEFDKLKRFVSEADKDSLNFDCFLEEE